LNIWRQRMTDNVNGINGVSFQTIYQNRILADANTFRSQTHPGGDGYWVGWNGPGCDNDDVQWTAPRDDGRSIMASAFNFLLTGDRSYADPVRLELLNQITTSGTDWTNTTTWCVGASGPSYQNYLNTMPWLIRLMLSFDYLNGGRYAGFSSQE